MKKFIRSILISAAIFAAYATAAEKVYMPPVGTTNIHSDYGIAAQKLMKTYIEDDGRFILIEGTVEDSVDISKPETLNNKAVSKGCSKILIAEFTRLGENVILSFKLYNTGSEAPIWQDRLKAANPDDFDPIIQRVARTIGTKQKATNDQDIYNVTQNETKQPKRMKAYSYFGLGLGGMVPLSPSVDMAPGLNVFGMYDTQSFLIGLDANFWGMSDDSRYNYLDFAISAYYAFGRKFIAPYIGGGMNYSAVDYNTDVTVHSKVTRYDSSIKDYKTTEEDTKKSYSDSKSGIGAFVGGGVMLNRASNIVLFAEAKYFVNFYKLAEPKDEITDEEWNKYDSWDSDSDLPSKSRKLFQGFMFNLKLGYGF
ncbi:outer membrane protein [Fibrobacter sp. UBA3718]|uniref:outer membrane protein n=1 Tax=Fibrobacter sp. UBA3718 TaxID=1946531 RepID=UPI0025BDC6CB|nr:hypothetical protein [Fibrobacter sp. UBA3718]